MCPWYLTLHELQHQRINLLNSIMHGRFCHISKIEAPTCPGDNGSISEKCLMLILSFNDGLQWPVNWSLASYEDVGEFFQNMFKDTAAPGTQLKDVMSTTLTVVTPETSVENAKKLLTKVGWLPLLCNSLSHMLLSRIQKIGAVLACP